MVTDPGINRIGFVGNYLPRRCGIATFTTDLCEAIATEYSDASCIALRAFEWFLGRNDLNLPLYDPTTGGCRDGLHPDRPNENQGAESTLAFLQTLVELRLTEEPLLTLETQAQ